MLAGTWRMECHSDWMNGWRKGGETRRMSGPSEEQHGWSGRVDRVACVEGEGGGIEQAAGCRRGRYVEPVQRLAKGDTTIRGAFCAWQGELRRGIAVKAWCGSQLRNASTTG